MVVAIDPETGRLGVPSVEQIGQLSAAEKTGLLRTPAGLTSVRRADGSVMVNLQGRFMEYSVVRLDASGRPRLGCVDEAAALSHWLVGCEDVPAPTPVPEVK